MIESKLRGKNSGGGVARVSVNNEVRTSNLVGLSSSATLADGKYSVLDGSGNSWIIAANFYRLHQGAPTRWGGVVPVQPGDNVTVSDRTSAGISGLTMTAADTAFGFFGTDASSFTNSSGGGFAAWYTDDSTIGAYPNIKIALNTASISADQVFDSVSAREAISGCVWWSPPKNCVEVMLDFGNAHSNGPCAIVVWDTATESAVYSISYGKKGTVDTSPGALNDISTRTVTFHHESTYIYFNLEQGGTVTGSHYYLYR